MSWTKEQFIEFCSKCGVDPKKALKEGSVSLRGPNVTGATLGSIKAKQQRKHRAIRIIHKIQDALGESNKAMALEEKAYGETKGVEHASPSFRVAIVGLRVRPIDPDNFCAGCKGIIDGLVVSGVIPDDNWKTVELTTSQKKVSTWEREGMRIVIESI